MYRLSSAVKPPAQVDHAHYVYSALPKRPLAHNPGQARLHAFVLLCLEHWEAEPAPECRRDPRFVGEYGSFTPDYRSWSQREYGLRIGIFRLLDALQAEGICPAIAANSSAAERFPQLVGKLNDWGCEWVAHGETASSMLHSGMRLEQQKDLIDQSLRRLSACTGQRSLGWLSQDWGSTPATFELLAQAGLSYTLDWCNDDQPYALSTEPEIMAIPVSAEWDDVQCQWLRNLDPHSHARLTLKAFDRLRLEAHQQQRDLVFGLCLHPWVSGMSSRIGALRQLLSDLRSRDDVHWSQPGDIFHHFRVQP